MHYILTVRSDILLWLRQIMKGVRIFTDSHVLHYGRLTAVVEIQWKILILVGEVYLPVLNHLKELLILGNF